MRRSSTILTASICERTRATSKKQTLWDAQTTGLCLVITPKVETGGGRRTWFYVARRGGKQVWVRLGEYQKERGTQDPSDVWSLDAARMEAARLAKIHGDGGDIRAVVQEQRQKKTLEELVLKYYDSVEFRKLATITRDNQKSMVKCHLLPAMGNRLVASIGSEDARQFYTSFEDRGIVPTGNNALNLLGKLLRFAERIGWRPEGPSPCTSVERHHKRSRERVLSADDYAAMAEAGQRMVGMGAEDVPPESLEAIYLMAFSGMRVSECVGLRWDCIDFEAKTVMIREHKTANTVGAKVIPLNPDMEAILKTKREACNLLWSACPWVFPARSRRGHKHRTTIEKAWILIRKEAGIAHAVPHDLRRSFETHGVELGFDVAIMESLVGHKLPGQQATYLRLSPTGLQAEASALTAAWVRAALDAKKPRLGERVGAGESEMRA